MQEKLFIHILYQEFAVRYAETLHLNKTIVYVCLVVTSLFFV